MADVTRARQLLNSCKEYCDLALLEVQSDDPEYQAPNAAIEQATDARGQLDKAIAELGGVDHLQAVRWRLEEALAAATPDGRVSAITAAMDALSAHRGAPCP